MLAHVIRNLAVGELIVAGDLGDRGPADRQGDRLLMRAAARRDHVGQPRRRLDRARASATRPRSRRSCGSRCATSGSPSSRRATASRSRRSSELARDGLRRRSGRRASRSRARDPRSRALARMQKAIAILQFKLEGAAVPRASPSGSSSTARCSTAIDPKTGTVELDGKMHPLLDTQFPTVDWARSVRAVARGAALPRRADQQLPRRARRCGGRCSSSSRSGSHVAAPRSLRDLPRLRAGRRARRASCRSRRRRAAHAAAALFDALDVVVQRAVRERATRPTSTWCSTCGPARARRASARTGWRRSRPTSSPTRRRTRRQEPVLQADPRRRVLREDPRASSASTDAGFIVNGHVPVKLEQGETAGEEVAAARSRSTARSPRRTATRASRSCSTPTACTSRSTTTSRAPTRRGRATSCRPSPTSRSTTGRAPSATPSTATELRAEIAALEQLVTAFETNTIERRE